MHGQMRFGGKLYLVKATFRFFFLLALCSAELLSSVTAFLQKTAADPTVFGILFS